MFNQLLQKKFNLSFTYKRKCVAHVGTFPLRMDRKSEFRWVKRQQVRDCLLKASTQSECRREG